MTTRSAILLAATVLTGAAQAALVSHYKFDGNANDATAGGNNLTGYAADTVTLPTISATGGQAGGYASFDGQNLFNTTNVPVTGDADRTFSMFIRTSTDNSGTDGSNTAFFGGWGGPGGGTRIRFDLGFEGGSNTQLRNEYNSGATTSSTTTSMTDGAWHHVAVTWNGATNTATFYLDGNAYGTGSVTNLFTATDVGLSIGGDTRAAGVLTGTSTQTPNRYFTGDIDDVRVYDEALDATAVAGLAAVPEPATAALLGLGGLALLRRRRRGN